ncbi:hypothetical protein ACLKA7_014983 [Drosophila subpalustris]
MISYWLIAEGTLKVREIAEIIGISKDRVGYILHDILGMRKLSAEWVLSLLTPDNKRNRETIFEQCRAQFKQDHNEFYRYVNVDETWIHWVHRRPRNSRYSGLYPAKLLRRRRRRYHWPRC